MLQVVLLRTSIVISTPVISSACPFSFLMIPLIWSLRSRSYCSSFFDTVDIGQLCPYKILDPLSVGGIVTLNATMAILSGLIDHVGDCYGAELLAISDPDLALKNSGNYNVRI
jgi:hypothetical protein